MDEHRPVPVVTGLRRAVLLPVGDLRRSAGIGALTATTSGWFPPLVTELTAGATTVTVRLVGARPARWGTAYGWLEADWRPPPSAAPAVLGEHGGRRLWVNLAAAPDVLTVAGDVDGCREFGRTLLAQLPETVGVVVVGDVLDGDLLAPRWRRVATVGDISDGDPATAVRVVVCAGNAVGDLWRRRVLSMASTRTVPIVLGDAPAGRWSVLLGARADVAVPADSGVTS